MNGEAQKPQADLEFYPDLIPIDEEVSIDSLQFRLATSHERLACCAEKGEDLQGKPILCGNSSSYVAPFKPGFVVSLCKEHKPPEHLIVLY